MKTGKKVDKSLVIRGIFLIIIGLSLYFTKYLNINISNTETINSVTEINSPENYNNAPFVEINENIPTFTKEQLENRVVYENYSELDSLGRCGVCEAVVGRETMPTEKRGEIGSVKPTGWHTVKYDNISGKYLYNRCHLIGYQLTAENANKQNLITGTRYLNVDGMLPFENEVANYVDETGNHVLYRVTPDFNGNELVARGVYIEAISLEDNGQGIKFNVYCFNIQPGININYETGESEKAK